MGTKFLPLILAILCLEFGLSYASEDRKDKETDIHIKELVIPDPRSVLNSIDPGLYLEGVKPRAREWPVLAADLSNHRTIESQSGLTDETPVQSRDAAAYAFGFTDRTPAQSRAAPVYVYGFTDKTPAQSRAAPVPSTGPNEVKPPQSLLKGVWSQIHKYWSDVKSFVGELLTKKLQFLKKPGLETKPAEVAPVQTRSFLETDPILNGENPSAGSLIEESPYSVDSDELMGMGARYFPSYPSDQGYPYKRPPITRRPRGPTYPYEYARLPLYPRSQRRRLYEPLPAKFVVVKKERPRGPKRYGSLPTYTQNNRGRDDIFPPWRQISPIPKGWAPGYNYLGSRRIQIYRQNRRRNRYDNWSPQKIGQNNPLRIVNDDYFYPELSVEGFKRIPLYQRYNVLKSTNPRLYAGNYRNTEVPNDVYEDRGALENLMDYANNDEIDDSYSGPIYS